VGWVDWNLALDTRGGPNLAENWCCAPVIVRPETDEVYVTPLYHVLAQFSRYLRPGAVRIGVDGELAGIMATAVRNPDGSLAVVLLNQGEDAVDYALRVGNRQVAVTLPAEAVQTVVLD
jgi:glucosylceramidase